MVKGQQNTDLAANVADIFEIFCFASPEIIGVKVCNKETDKFIDTIYRGI